MIDARDGSLKLFELKVFSGARLGDLEKALGQRAQEVMRNGPYVTLNVREAQLGKHEASVNLYFQDEALHAVEFCLRHGPPRTWADFDRGYEARLKEEHDQLVQAAMGDRWERDWGRVSSYLDRDGTAHILIEYEG